MENKEMVVASHFVDLALKYKHYWVKIEELPDDEMQILLDTVSAAGFKPKAVVFKKLVGQYRDQDGPTGETYPINELCPIKVVNKSDGDNYLATGWLDCVLRQVIFGANQMNEGLDELVETITFEIGRSIPLLPIKLTRENDFLQEPDPPLGHGHLKYLVNHTKDEDSLFRNRIGLHAVCGNSLERRPGSKTHSVIICNSCFLRVPFPKEIATYGKLRLYLETKLNTISVT